jgi:NAD(P)H dehydrogenase (quinone)
MSIGIVVHSQTGHTLSLAVILKERLLAAGHAVTLEQVEPFGRAKPGAANVQLKTKPEIDAYDALVFGCPVWGGVMSSAMTSYLEQATSLQGKRVACLATHIFPPGLGGNQTISHMKEICESKGAIVCGSGSVSWFPLGRKRRIAEVVNDLIRALESERS